MLDYNKPEYPQFTDKSERAKHLNILKWLFTGDVITNTINNSAAAELINWCSSLLGDYADNKPFILLIQLLKI